MKGAGLTVQAWSPLFFTLENYETVSSLQIWRDSHSQWRGVRCHLHGKDLLVPLPSLQPHHGPPALSTAALQGITLHNPLTHGWWLWKRKKFNDGGSFRSSAWVCSAAPVWMCCIKWMKPRTQSWFVSPRANIPWDQLVPKQSSQHLFLGNIGCDSVNSTGTGSLISSVSASHTPTWSPIFTGFLRAALESCDNPGD